MVRTAALLPLLFLAAMPPQEGPALPQLIENLSSIGRLRSKRGAGDPRPCVYLKTPAGDKIVGVIGTVEANFSPFEVVFRPESPLPIVRDAEFLAQGERMSWFRLAGEVDVKPLDVVHVPGLRRGGTLYVAGAEQIPAAEPGTPPLTVNRLTLGIATAAVYNEKSQCLSLKARLPRRDLTAVALFDMQGRLAGLLPPGGPQAALTPGDILDQVEGTVLSSEVTGLKDEEGKLKGKWTATLTNPLGRMKSVTLHVLQRHQVKDFPMAPDAEGVWPAMSDKAAVVRFAIEQNQAKADLDIAMDSTRERTWIYQLRVVRGDGTVRASNWAFIDGRKLSHPAHFSRVGPEPPQVPKPRDPPGTPPKLAAITTGTPSATGFRFATKSRVFQGAQVTQALDVESVVDGCWSADAKHAYLLDDMNVVRKIAIPEFREVCEFGIGYECGVLRRSAEGVVVHVTGLDELWVLSLGNLALKTRIALGNPAKVSMGENSGTAWVRTQHDEIMAVDLAAGRIVKRIAATSLEPGAAKAVRPAEVERLSFFDFEVSPDGRTLVAFSNKQLHRFSVSGNSLSYVEVGPPLLGRPSTLGFSPDSYYFVSSTDMSSSVYRSGDLAVPVVEYAGATVLGFDKAAGQLYGRSRGGAPVNVGHGLAVLRADGLVERSLPCEGRRILVHPGGSRLLSLGNQLNFVELIE